MTEGELIFLRLIFIGQTTRLVFIYSFLFTAPQHENHPSISVSTISTKFFFYKKVISQTVWTVRWVTAVQRYSHLKLVVYSYYKKTSSEHTNEFFFSATRVLLMYNWVWEVYLDAPGRRHVVWSGKEVSFIQYKSMLGFHVYAPLHTFPETGCQI